MRERRSGFVVFVSSVVGRLTMPFNGIYSSSKFALEALAEGLSYELRPFDVEVAIVEPGAYATNIINAVVSPDDEQRLASYGDVAKGADAVVEGLTATAGKPIEVADAIAALVAAKPGTRPLRTVVPDSPVVQLNAAIAPFQRGFLEGAGLGAFLRPEPSGVS